MKSTLITLALAASTLFTTQKAHAQITAMDFTMVDCSTTPATHNLFSDLNSGKVVIIEFFMTSCTSCITAGSKLESMKTKLLMQYPGKVKPYAFGFNNTYSCATVNNWVTSNGFSSIPSDSGATQVAYYGGMGMPTIVIIGGTNHKLLGSPYIGFTTSDTTMMATDIRNFFATATGINELKTNLSELNIYPNPAANEVKISFNLMENANTVIEIMDVTGRIVKTLLNEKMSIGSSTKTFNVSGLDNGNYIVRINTDGHMTQQKLSIIR